MTDIVAGAMRLNALGEIAARTWHDLPNHVANVQLDAFVVIPNHVHGIIVITDDLVGAGSERALNAIRRYIADNPRRRESDREHPRARKTREAAP